MLVVFNNKKTIEYSAMTTIEPLQTTDLVVIAMDLSKTNFAMVIGSPDGRVIEIVEFSGNNRGAGPAMNTTVYCSELRRFLSRYLSNVKLYIVATEAALTEKGPKANHITNMALTEIRASILAFFYDTFDIQVIQVNNWSWKHSELPEGYRSPYQKMSKVYIQRTDPTNPLCDYFHEDACDAYFIFKYIIRTMCNGFTLICSGSEQQNKDYAYYITGTDNKSLEKLKEMTYNNQFSIIDNLTYYNNRMNDDFYIIVPIEDLDMEEIYDKCVEVTEDILTQKDAAVVIC